MKAPVFASIVLVSACGSVLASLYPPLAVRSPVGDPDVENPISWTGGPKDVIAADLDGDGRRDIVTANLDGSVSVLLVKPTGVLPQILCPARGLLEGASLRAVCAADFNEDGRLDVAAADITGHVVLLLGQGDGRLVAFLEDVRRACTGDRGRRRERRRSRRPPRRREPAGLRAPVRRERPHRGPLRPPPRRERRGAFAEPVTVAAGLSGCVYDLVLADVDRDGRMDAVTLEYLCGQEGGRQGVGYLTILGNDGQGGLRPENVLRTNGLGGRSLAVAFLDEARDHLGGGAGGGDRGHRGREPRQRHARGLPRPGRLRLRGLPDGLRRGCPRSVAAGDLDRDGLVDLVVTNRNANSISVLHNLDEITFSAPDEPPAGTSPRELVVEDLDGDGLADAAVANRISQDVSFYRGTVSAPGLQISKGYYRAGMTPLDVVTGDFNADGHPDAAVVSARSHDLHVRLGDGTGALGEETVYPLNHRPTTLAAADLDGDGALDLVAACSGQGTVPTTPSGVPETSGASTAPALLTLRGRGDGTFEDPTPTFVEGIQPYWLRVGDLSGDGAPDVAVSGRDGSLRLLEGLGDGRFGRSASLPSEADGRPVTITLGDFNGDGKLDMATSRCVLYLNDGRFFEPGWSGEVRTFGVTAPPGTTARSFVIESTDLDVDGNLDVLLTVTFVRPDPIAVFYGNGDGTFGTPDIRRGPGCRRRGHCRGGCGRRRQEGPLHWEPLRLERDHHEGQGGSEVRAPRDRHRVPRGGDGGRRPERRRTTGHRGSRTRAVGLGERRRELVGRAAARGPAVPPPRGRHRHQRSWSRRTRLSRAARRRTGSRSSTRPPPRDPSMDGRSASTGATTRSWTGRSRPAGSWSPARIRWSGARRRSSRGRASSATPSSSTPRARRSPWWTPRAASRAGCRSLRSRRTSRGPRCYDAALQFGISSIPSPGRYNFRPGNMDPWVVPGNPRFVPGSDRVAIAARPMDDLGIAYASVHLHAPTSGEAWRQSSRTTGATATARPATGSSPRRSPTSRRRRMSGTTSVSWISRVRSPPTPGTRPSSRVCPSSGRPRPNVPFGSPRSSRTTTDESTTSGERPRTGWRSRTAGARRRPSPTSR